MRARLDEVLDRRGEPGEREPVGVAHHRHHQALLGLDRDPDVDVLLLDDRVLEHRGVQARELAQRAHAWRARRRAGRRGAKPWSCCEARLCASRTRDDAAPCRSRPPCRRAGSTRFESTMCSATSLRSGVIGMTRSPSWMRSGRSRRRTCAALRRRRGAAGAAAGAAGGGRGGRARGAALRGRARSTSPCVTRPPAPVPSTPRRSTPASSAARARDRRRARRLGGGRRGAGARRRRGGFGGGGAAAAAFGAASRRGAARGRLRAGAIRTSTRAHRDRLALGSQDLLDHAGHGRGDLGVDLVGRHLDERLVAARRGRLPSRASARRSPRRRSRRAPEAPP